MQNYPIDIIAYGENFPSSEVKSGKLSVANLISKSLRLASDRSLSNWMSANNISGGEDLQAGNLARAQNLAEKMGISGPITQEEADQWGMSQGLIPNFAKGKQWKKLINNLIELYENGKIKNRHDIANALEIDINNLSNYAYNKQQTKKVEGGIKQYGVSDAMIKKIGSKKFKKFQEIYDKVSLKDISEKNFKEGREYESLIGWLIGPEPAYNARLDWTGARSVSAAPNGSGLKVNDYIGARQKELPQKL